MEVEELKITPQENGIGVIVNNHNLSEFLSSDNVSKIQDLLNKYRLIIFQNQNLTDNQLKEFAHRFGSPFVPDINSPVLGSKDSANAIVIVGNQAHEYTHSYLGHQEVLPHSDHQWLQRPSAASLLYAVDIQENAAPTIWIDMVQVYNDLEFETKQAIKDLQLITYNPFHRPFGSVSGKYVDSRIEIPPGEVFEHPLVRTHPNTHEKILYLNIAYEMEIIGIPYEEGSQLVAKLHNHIISSKYRYEHNWKNGDLVFWDNRATLHYRPAFDATTRRVLKRVTVAGEIPA